MTKNFKLDASIANYNNPYEICRMERYFPSLRLCDINLPKFASNYDTNVKIGVAVCTYGSVPYIELQLYYLKNINKIENVVIIDDCSDKREQLISLAKQYGVDFISTKTHLPYIQNVGSSGDTAGILFAIQWAKQKGLDIVVKLSRRFIPCFNWIDDFKKLAIESQALTFSSYCKSDRFNFRTECIGMNVDAWSQDFIINILKDYIDRDYLIFAEFWFHEIAKLLSYNNVSDVWSKFNKTQNLNYFRSGYALLLDLMGDDRYSNHLRNSNVLWHMYNSKEDYLKKLNEVDIKKYTLNDL